MIKKTPVNLNFYYTGKRRMNLLGEQITPDAVGTEVGVIADLRKGHPKPREIKSQSTQLAKGAGHGTSNDTKLSMSQKVRGQD